MGRETRLRGSFDLPTQRLQSLDTATGTPAATTRNHHKHLPPPATCSFHPAAKASPAARLRRNQDRRCPHPGLRQKGGAAGFSKKLSKTINFICFSNFLCIFVMSKADTTPWNPKSNPHRFALPAHCRLCHPRGHAADVPRSAEPHPLHHRALHAGRRKCHLGPRLTTPGRERPAIAPPHRGPTQSEGDGPKKAAPEAAVRRRPPGGRQPGKGL